MSIIVSRYRSVCAACNADIIPGDRIHWSRGTQPRHEACVEAAPQGRYRTHAEALAAGYVGLADARHELRLTIARVVTLPPNQFGVSYFHIMHDNDGREVVWRSSKPTDLASGDIVIMATTIKELTEYRGKPQTVITRASVVRKVGRIELRQAPQEPTKQPVGSNETPTPSDGDDWCPL